jgi:hypothetical protein
VALGEVGTPYGTGGHGLWNRWARLMGKGEARLMEQVGAAYGKGEARPMEQVCTAYGTCGHGLWNMWERLMEQAGTAYGTGGRGFEIGGRAEEQVGVGRDKVEAASRTSGRCI